LVDAQSTLSEGYMLVNTNTTPGAGIVGQTIQFHGTADRYTLSGASSLATLYSTAQTATANPAVTMRSVGSNGGQAAAFTYDLARSIVLTRQGNPAWAGQERDGQTPIRSDDLFYGPATFDPQPNWVDLNKVAIPQADEQQRLLANTIIFMNAVKNLLPRFWYFPHGYEAAVVMTGDDHAGGGTVGRFGQYAALSPAGSSVADWQGIRGTSYMYPYAAMTDTQAAAYNASGFELGLHLNTGCADYTRASLTAYFTDQLGQFKALYPSLPAQVTHRTHCIAWSDYTTMAEVSLSFGIRLDANYYYWPPAWVADKAGLFTGSGMPMRFATAAGNTLNIYQAATQMTDESGQSYPYTVDTLLDRALGVEGYYGAFVANMHTDTASSPGSDAIVLSAMTRGVPVISARQLLTWLDARNAASIKSIVWNASSSRQTFSVQASAGAKGLQAMVPMPGGHNVSGVKSNGLAVTYYYRTVKGYQYVLFPAGTADYEVAFAVDNTPPTVTGTWPPNGATGVGLSTNVTVTFSEAMDGLSINASTITLSDAVGNSVPGTVSYSPATLSAVLTPATPLALATTYTASVKGGTGGVTDLAGNALPSNFFWSFTTTNQYASTIWPSTALPGLADAGPDSAVELGVQFRSAVAGRITGIRFYKATANTGTHVGNLWASNGTRLATATFSGESASGWQQVLFSTPVAISANTVYVASYHANNGHCSADDNYFLAQGVDNYPLHALGAAENGGNGVYRYGTSSAFPNQTFNAANYWVDIVFTSP
jgi:hypothetical protein